MKNSCCGCFPAIIAFYTLYMVVLFVMFYDGRTIGIKLSGSKDTIHKGIVKNFAGDGIKIDKKVEGYKEII